MIRIDTTHRDIKLNALEVLREHRYYKKKLSLRSRIRYKQNITKFFNEIDKNPNDIKKEDIEAYIDNYKVGENKDETPKFNTLNVIKNAILCYYNRVLQKKFKVAVLGKRKRNIFYSLKEDQYH